MRNKLIRIVPWVVALAILGYLFSTFKIADALAALKHAAPWTVPAIVGAVLLVYLADSLAIWKTFGWFLARLSFKEVLVVRGAAYLLAILNYNLGQGAIIYFVHKSRGVSLVRGTAAVLLVMGINVLLLLFVASVGLVVAPDVPHALKIVVAVGYAGLAIYLVAVAVKPRWLTSRPVFDVLLGAGLLGHLKALVVRVPHLASLIFLTVVYLRAFGVEVPIAQAVAYLPIVFFIAVLPISPLGLGTSQAAMQYFFARYAAGDLAMQKATIVTASLSAQLIAVSVQALIGLACLRNQMARDLRPAPSPP
jgi:uncharacterized membrane protein YbhN (UPF0104 family)